MKNKIIKRIYIIGSLLLFMFSLTNTVFGEEAGYRLWDTKYKNCVTYCIEKGAGWKPNVKYELGRQVDLSSSGVSDKEKALAYVLSKNDYFTTSFNGLVEDANTYIAREGFYRLTSIKQAAIYAVLKNSDPINKEWVFKNNTYWVNENKLELSYKGTTGYLTKGAGNKWTFSDELECGNSSITISDNTYRKGLTLYEEAVEFAKSYKTDFAKNNVATNNVDYESSESLILIGPYNYNFYGKVKSVVFKDLKDNTLNSRSFSLYQKFIWRVF